jgi:hypothetical protein
MAIRRFTRITNAFSKKLNRRALFTSPITICRIHKSLRVTPPMAAGVTDRLWSVEDLVVLWEAYEDQRPERAA